jgi:hypothetical protein
LEGWSADDVCLYYPIVGCFWKDIVDLKSGLFDDRPRGGSEPQMTIALSTFTKFKISIFRITSLVLIRIFPLSGQWGVDH